MSGAASKRQIHSLRKKIQFLRSSLRLHYFQLQPSFFKAKDIKLKNAARKLSRVRDADVMKDTFHRLKSYFTHAIGEEAAAKAEQDLDRYCRNVRRISIKKTTVSEIEKTIKQVNRQLKKQISHTELDLTGIQRSYGKAYRFCRAVDAHSPGEQFHAWRKSTKYLRYQILILMQYKLKSLKSHEESLQRLVKLLGENQDFEVFLTLVTTNAILGHVSDKTKSSLTHHILDLQTALVRQAIKLGKKIYKYPPKKYLRKTFGKLSPSQFSVVFV